jgi:hypothetical protein
MEIDSNLDINNQDTSTINEKKKSKGKPKQKKKGKIKIKNEVFNVLQMNEYDKLQVYDYKVHQLKDMCRHYNIKKSGNKNELSNRLYDYLKYSLYVINIQKIFRGYITREYKKNSGLIPNNQKKCINDSDFATLEPLKDIIFNQFFCFNGNGPHYGYDIYSLYNLINIQDKIHKLDTPKEIRNPYDREIITQNEITKFSRHIRLSRLLKIPITIKDDNIESIDPKKKMEMRIIEIFQYINELGNYADSNWFSSLPRHMMLMFIREMYDIWNYRAQLTSQIKNDIVPPHGNPFTGMSLHLAQARDDEYLKNTALRIIELLVKSAHLNENRTLGAYYVLTALTLVSDDARNALPWLYTSVAY